jgi:hypothetical protein
MSITSSKISFGTQFKAHILANRVARHLRLEKLEKEQKKEKDVTTGSTVHLPLVCVYTVGTVCVHSVHTVACARPRVAHARGACVSTAWIHRAGYVY